MQNEIENTDKPIGQTIKPLLGIIENAIWKFEVMSGELPQFDNDSFRAAVKIFMTAMIERIWILQEKEGMPSEERVNMVLSAAAELQKIIKVYADIDTKEMYGDITINEQPA